MKNEPKTTCKRDLWTARQIVCAFAVLLEKRQFTHFGFASTSQELVLIWSYVMYVYSTCWSKEENRNKSQQKWWAEHCWPSRPPRLAAELQSARLGLKHCSTVFMMFRYWGQHHSWTQSPTEELLTTYIQPLEPSVSNRNHWVHILHPYQYAF